MRKFDQSREIALFIDKLRSFRNIAQEDFLHDIISMRQYRRYMNGDSTLSYLVLDKLAKKLGFNAEFVIMELETEKMKQTQSVNNFYNSIVGNDVDKSKELVLKIDERHLIEGNNLLLFQHSKNIFDYKLGNTSEYVTINRTKKLIDLDQLIKKKALSTSELLILISFFHFKSFKEINVIAEKLASYIDNHVTIVSGHNIRVLALVLEELSRYFSINEDYENMLYYALEGIKYSTSMRSYYLLDTLYYFAAAASHELNQIDKRNDYLFKCLSLLYMEGNSERISKYKYLFKNRFDVDMQITPIV
ncbi:MAG: hypothetical protein KKH92_06095 [Firmicutes bacterium]|nr:hypothetical protein [Bacillota bacterium]